MGLTHPPCFTPLSHLCRVWPSLYRALRNFKIKKKIFKILGPVTLRAPGPGNFAPPPPSWVRPCTCGWPPPSGEWYDFWTAPFHFNAGLRICHCSVASCRLGFKGLLHYGNCNYCYLRQSGRLWFAYDRKSNNICSQRGRGWGDRLVVS